MASILIEWMNRKQIIMLFNTTYIIYVRKNIQNII
jgi:hypothetical protein